MGVLRRVLVPFLGLTVVASGAAWVFPTTAGAVPTAADVASGDIAFQVTVAGVGEELDVHLLDPSTSEVNRLLEDLSVVDSGPAWSPDGSYLAFASSRTGNHEIHVLEMASGRITQLTNHPATDLRPDWSPDGKRLVFDSDRDGNWENDVLGAFDIYVKPFQGGDTIRLTDDPAEDVAPAWSPDGSQVAFWSNRDGNPDLYIMGSDGTGLRQLTSDPADDFSPAWSPDGSQIVFSSERSGNRDLYVIAPDGTGLRQLTDDPASDVTPAWSPDGNQIVFARARDLYVMAADGTDVIRLTDDPVHQRSPDWQPLRPTSRTLGLFDSDTGRWLVREPDGSTRSFYFGIPGDVGIAGDWDCEGHVSPGVYRPSDGTVYFTNALSGGVADGSVSLGAGVRALAGDFDGDGCDTLASWEPSSGLVRLSDEVLSATHTEFTDARSYYFGVPGDTPFTGDFDGDGTSTIGIRRGGKVFLGNTHETGVADLQFSFGNNADVPLIGDWNVNGTDTVGVYRSSSMEFLLRGENTFGVADETVLLMSTRPLSPIVLATTTHVGDQYVGVVYSDAAQFDLTSFGGWLFIFFSPDPAYAVSHMADGEVHMLWLLAKVGKTEDGRTIWEVLDVITFPEPWPSRDLAISGCLSDSEGIDEELHGLAELDNDTWTLSRVWRANRAEARWEELPVDGLTLHPASGTCELGADLS